MIQEDKASEASYKSRISRVFTFIDENLASDLSLETVSSVAYYSPFHFHRVFKFISGETLNAYVLRRRVEKSALDLLHTNVPVTEIAYKYGFGDNSSFSRAFKKYFDVSPTKFKQQNPNRHSKIRQLDSKIGQAYPDHEKYIRIINDLQKWTSMNAKIEVSETQAMTMAGMTHVGVQGLEQTFEKLIRWATPKGFMDNPEARMGRVFYDSFKVTAPDKVRMSIFLTTNKAFDSEDTIEELRMAGGKCIVGRFEIAPMEFEKAWTSLFIWMNDHGYKKRAENPFEIYHNDHREHPEHKFIVDLYIPIQ